MLKSDRELEVNQLKLYHFLETSKKGARAFKEFPAVHRVKARKEL